jgi:hypothetical protein
VTLEHGVTRRENRSIIYGNRLAVTKPLKGLQQRLLSRVNPLGRSQRHETSKNLGGTHGDIAIQPLFHLLLVIGNQRALARGVTPLRFEFCLGDDSPTTALAGFSETDSGCAKVMVDTLHFTARTGDLPGVGFGFSYIGSCLPICRRTTTRPKGHVAMDASREGKRVCEWIKNVRGLHQPHRRGISGDDFGLSVIAYSLSQLGHILKPV